MHARLLAATAATLALGAASAAHAQTFNAKTGEWEMTITTTLTGNPFPADALAAMPAAKRAEVEAELKRRSGKPATNTYRTCLTKEDLTQDRFLRSEGDEICTRKIITRTPTKLVLQQTCPPPRASTGQSTIEVKAPDRIVANIDSKVNGGAARIRSDISGKWIGEKCEKE
jgi:hypothetical protein